MIRLLLTSLVVVVLLGVTGVLVTARWAPEWGGQVVVFAAGVNLAACWAAFVPMILVRRKRADHLAQAALGATAVRLLVVAAAMLVAMLRGPWWTMALAAWMVIFYLALLAVETGWTVRLLARSPDATDGCTAA